MTTREHRSKHDREIAEIWTLMGKLAKGTLAAQDETRELRVELRLGLRELRLEMHKMQVEMRKMQDEARQEMSEIRTSIRELTAAQKRTEATLKAFIESIRRGGNGHTKRKIDLQ